MGVTFHTVADKLRRLPLPPRYAKFLCLDPGETTGWAFFNFPDITTVDSLELESGQLETKDIPQGVDAVQGLLDKYKSEYLIVESYRIYGWRIREHAWADLHTPRLIGAIQALVHLRNLRIVMQTAQQGKDFATDDRLVEWGLWAKGERHARDAIRHGVAYVLFDKASK